MDYAHKRGLLHRDVKPANIIVAERRQSSTTISSSSNAPTTFTPTSNSTAAAPPPAQTSAAPEPPPTAPTVVRTPTVSTPGDELPNIDGADWAGFSRAMEQGWSPEGYELMFGVTFTDSAAWVCDCDKQGADQAAVEDRLVDKYDGLSYGDASVIYRSAMDWVCPLAGPVAAPKVTATPDYQSAVRITLSRAGYELPNATGAVYVLNEARDGVCQHRNTNAEVVNTQI